MTHIQLKDQQIKRTAHNRGVAIILVISVLAVLTSLAAAFLISARLETIKSLNFLEGIRAGYIAEGGLSHAKRLLKEDKQSTATDTLDETWRMAFDGSDVDNNEDSTAEAKWINLIDASGTMYGRYAVTVTDEASRININAAGFHNEQELKVTEGYSTFEVSLNKFFTFLGLASATTMRDDILQYRYGGNYPGSSVANTDDNENNIYFSNDGLDNDADGVIDEASEGVNEPHEFVSYYPYGDDRPFFSIFELQNIASVEPNFSDIRPFVTAYSFDHNTDKDNALRLGLNQATALELKNVFASAALSGNEQLAVNIVDYRDSDNESSVLVAGTDTHYGVEAVRFNEIMINPKYGYSATTLTNPTGPGGDWSLAGDHYENSNPTVNEFGRGIWQFEGLRPGTYYLRVFGVAEGDIVGDVKVSGVTHSGMVHGEMYVDPVVVGGDGRLDLTMYNKEVDKGSNYTVYFKSFQLIESPDAEYIELINISNKDIDVSGWEVEGLRANDLIASVPSGTVIESFDYLVLAVDKDDTGVTVPLNLRSNGISLLNSWSGSTIDSDKVVQLSFSDTLSREDDVITDTPSVYDTILLLKASNGTIVDRVEYFENYYANVSFERGDPAATDDQDGDFIFDDWAVSYGFPFFLPVGTPTAQNDNLSISGHTIGGMNSEVIVKNGQFANVGEVASVSSGVNWQRITTTDLMQFCDKLTTDSYRLEAEEHLENGGGWQEVSRSSPYTNWFHSSSAGEMGTWKFTQDDRFLDGVYTLVIYGTYGEAFSISLKLSDESWSDFTPPLMPDVDNAVKYGIIDIGGSGTNALPSKTVEMRINNESSSDECHFDYIVLSPVNSVEGRININTAPAEVLQALPGVSNEIATAIIDNRPYGETYGIGDVLAGDVLGASESLKKEAFRNICNLVTVKSDVYEILITGQSFREGRRTGEKKLRVIVER